MFIQKIAARLRNLAPHGKLVRSMSVGPTIALALCIAEPVRAQEQVTFETPPVQQSAFRIRQAEAQGRTLEPTPGMILTGALFVPDGDGPHPAVVLLPESVEARHSYEAWANHLTENGYVTLLVESLVSRDETVLRDDLPINLLIDAQGGLTFLSEMDIVDPQRIGLFGIGMSGWYVQRSLDVGFTRGSENASFYAGVSLYPHCVPDMELLAPVLVLIGGQDRRVSLASCRAMIALNTPQHAHTKLQIYPEATHFFDNTAYAKTAEHRNDDWREPSLFEENDYDPSARQDAEQQVLEFLRNAGDAQ